MKSKHKEFYDPLAEKSEYYVQIEFILRFMIKEIRFSHHWCFSSIFLALSVSQLLELEWETVVNHNSHWKLLGKNKNNLHQYKKRRKNNFYSSYIVIWNFSSD